MVWTTWKKELEEQLEGEELVGLNISGRLYRRNEIEEGLKRLARGFDDDVGEGESFWAWTKASVFFCICYDGSESLIKIPCKPSKGDPSHYGS